MGLLDRVEGGVVPARPPEPEELRLAALERGLAVAAVRAAGAGLEDTVVAATVTAAEAAAAGLVGAGVVAAAGIAVTGVVGAAFAAAELSAAGALAGLLVSALVAGTLLAAVLLALARDLEVAMAGEGGAREVVRWEELLGRDATLSRPATSCR